jgi:hypothetical protein
LKKKKFREKNKRKPGEALEQAMADYKQAMASYDEKARASFTQLKHSGKFRKFQN